MTQHKLSFRWRCLYLLIAWLSLTSLVAAQLPSRRPLIVIFAEREDTKGDQLDQNVGIASPLAELLEATRRVDVLVYETDASYIQRAIQEGLLQASEAVATPSAEQKRRIVQALGGEVALTVRAVWREKPPEPLRQPRGRRADLNQLKDLPANPVVLVSAVWMPISGGRVWQVQLESQPVQRALPGGRVAIDPVSTARTAASNLVTRLLAEPMANLARIETTQREAQEARANIPVATQTDSEQMMRQFLEEGDRFARAGDLANAIESYRRAADVRPTHPEPRRRLIDAYLKRRMEEAALEEGLRAMEMVSDSSALWLLVADAYMSANRLQEAENLYRRMLERDPQNITAWLHLGDLLWNRARIGEAEACYQQAVQHAPDNPEPLLRLVRLNLARARFEPAQQALQQLYTLLADAEEARLSSVYVSLADGVETNLQQIAQRAQEATASYNNRDITRETLYRTIRGLELQTAQLHQFHRALRPTQRLLEAHQRFLLAASLLQQSLGSLLSFAETDEPRYQDESSLLRSEALRELAAASRALRAAMQELTRTP